MLFDLMTLIIEASSTIVLAACLLRFYLRYLKMNFSPTSANPFSHVLLPLSNWLITPLRKIIPLSGRFDVSALLASYLIVLAKIVLLATLSSAPYLGIQMPLSALFNLLDLALSGLMGLVLVYVLFSWTQTYSPTQELFHEMIDPLLNPIRKVSPKISGVDTSALILMLLIQISKMILGHTQRIVLNLI